MVYTDSIFNFHPNLYIDIPVSLFCASISQITILTMTYEKDDCSLFSVSFICFLKAFNSSSLDSSLSSSSSSSSILSSSSSELLPSSSSPTQYNRHSSHFFRLTNFHNFSRVFHSFTSIFKVPFYLKYGTIFTGFSVLLADKFPKLFQYLFSIFQFNFF